MSVPRSPGVQGQTVSEIEVTPSGDSTGDSKLKIKYGAVEILIVNAES